MSILQHPETQISELGSVRRGETTVTQPPPADGEPTDQTQGKTIFLDGPLSSYYTKALNELFANKAETKIGQETQQMESSLMAGIHNYQEKKDIDQEKITEGAYVYVTDDDKLEATGVANASDSLRIALDMKNVKYRALCIESIHPNRKTELLSQFARDNGFKVFYSRRALVSSLKAF